MQFDPQLEQESGTLSGLSTDAPSWSAPLTLADGLYLLVLVLAAVIRLSSLDRIPLSPAEAQEALAAWRFLQPGTESLTVGSPAYFTLTSLLIPILGASDTVARLVPALFGLGIISLPWFIRARLGAIGSLIGALFLAASPLNSAISRTAGGDAIAQFTILLIVVSLLHIHQDKTGRWLYVLAFALGLGLTTSPLFYSGLITLAAAWVLANIYSDRLFTLEHVPEHTVRNAFFLGLAVFVMLSTRFLTYPSGLGASARLISDWLGQFGLADSWTAMLAPYGVLGRYEIALVSAGLVSAVWAIGKQRPLRLLFLIWLLAVMIIMLVQGGELSNALLATLPGYLLIGLFSAVLLNKQFGRWTWLLVGGLLLTGAILLVNVTRYLRVSVYEQDVSNLWFSFLALAAAVLMIYYFWSMTDAAIPSAIWLAALTLLLLYQWGTAWRLAYLAANDPRESWVIEGTDDDIHILLQTLRDISRQATNSDTDLEIFSAVDTPALHWYLRDFRQALVGESLPPTAGYQALLSPAGQQDPRLAADYIGSDFGLLRSGSVSPQPSATPWADMLRWWLFQETTATTLEERVVLWVRSDLIFAQP